MLAVRISHALKGGFQFNHAIENSYYDVAPWHMVAQLRNGVPSSVLIDDTPVYNWPGHNEWGLFFQDSWTLKRLTVNPGLRYDWFHPYIAAQDAPASPWLPSRHYDPIDDLLAFKNWSPRLGVVYDVFGNGKTAIKLHLGKYVAILGNSSADIYNPLSSTLTDQRTWRDTNGDLFPQYTEVGPSTITNFGVNRPRFQNPNLVREQQVEYSASLQHQLLPNMSVSAGYYHRTFYNLTKLVNTLVDPATDFTPVQLPDPRGNGQTITIYNLKAAKFGRTNFVDTTSPTNRLYWDGIDLSAQGRFGKGGRVFSGVTLGGTSQNMCDVVDPNFTGTLASPVWGNQFCEQSAPWMKPLLKLGGSMPLPLDTQVSGSFSSFPGASNSITYGVTRTIYPQLVQTSITVPLDDPSNPGRYLPRINQLDLRFAKKIPMVGSKRLLLQFDIFNVLNSNPTLAAVSSFGPTVYTPNTIMQGRLFQVGTQFFF